MATSIFFNGRLISKPGAYSEVDASGLDVVGLGAAGIVAVLGTAEGGRPVSSITDKEDIQRFTSAQNARNAFRSGDLFEVANMLFKPSVDGDIPGGAAQYVAMKTNPATQSAVTLENADGPAMVVTSRDYGAFTEQISIELADGTSQGKQVTITFENQVESEDNIGGDALANLEYFPGAGGYDTALADVAANGDITVNATKAELGRDGDLDNPITNVAAEILSADVGDTASVELIGLSGGAIVIEELTLNGTTVVPGTTVWDAGGLLGIRISGTTAGVVTAREIGGGGVDVFTVPAGTDAEEGLVTCSNCYVNDAALSFAADAATTQQVLVLGTDKVGAARNEIVTLNGTTPVVTVLDDFAFIDVLVLGDVEVARTVTVSVEAAQSRAIVQDTILKVSDYFNAKQTQISASVFEGFVFTLQTGLTSFNPADFDIIAASSIITGGLDLTADFWSLLAWINQNSSLVSAAEASGATGIPDNTPSPAFLAGGIEGVATFTDYQNALNLLKQIRVNTIVDLSGDPAVAAALDAHCAYMGGVGKLERDGTVGILNATLDDVPTKSEIKSAIVNLNTRHIRAAGQAVSRYNAAGEVTEFLSPFIGALAAGMQAGTDVGESLTHKFVDCLGIRQHSSWNPVDDAEEMIQAGLFYLEDVDGRGRRVARNITTYLQDNNLAFTEASVNEAVNFAVLNLREGLEFAIGQKGFEGTKSAVRAQAINILGLLVDEEVLTGFRNIDVTLSGDVMEVSVEIAPVIPINFVKITAHLVTQAQLANAA